MSSPSVEETIKKTVCRIVRRPESDFTRATTFKDLNADSLDIVQMLVAIEDTYNIEIQDEELKKVTNMGDFIDYIERKVAARV